MTPIIVFITGANRGLGLGLVKGFVAKLGHINSYFFLFHSHLQFNAVTNTKSRIDFIAAVRDPAHSTIGTCRL
jgi:hypothetical protein